MALIQKNHSGRDIQRSRVYAWEALASGKTCQVNQLLTTSACQQFARMVWRQEAKRFGLQVRSMPAFIEPHATQKYAWSIIGQSTSLPDWAKNHWVILHELAHHLCPPVDGEGSHGPSFAGCLIGLLGRYAGYDAADLVHSANCCGLQVSPVFIGPVPESAIGLRIQRFVQEQQPVCLIDVSDYFGLPLYLAQRVLTTSINAGRVACKRGKFVAHKS